MSKKNGRSFFESKKSLSENAINKSLIIKSLAMIIGRILITALRFLIVNQIRVAVVGVMKTGSRVSSAKSI